MGLPRGIRKALAAAVLGAAAVSLVPGCATPPRRDWRQAAKAGDYAFAYSDLFESWRAGTPDIKAESLRYAWRDPGIVAAAQPDLASRIRELAARHAGDLASLAKQVKDGPLEDRAEFAKLVDRRIDVDGEIRAAYERHAPPPVVAPAPPHAVAPKAAAPGPVQPAAQPAPRPAPVPATEALPSDLLAQVAEAKARASWRCREAGACDRAWAAAEGFVGRNADMRIRAVTATSIETYPPIVIGEIGMSVEKVAVGAGEWEIRPMVHCRVGKLRQVCPTAELRIYTAFPGFLRSAAK